MGLVGAGLLAGAGVTVLLIVGGGAVIGYVPSGVRITAFATVAALAVAMQVMRPRWRFPNIHRQVPEIVFTRGERRSGFRFGFELGLGWRTQLTTVAPQTVALACLLGAPGWTTPALAGAGFALGRFLHLAARLLSGDGDAWDERLQRFRGLLPTVSVAAIVAIALALSPA